MKKKTLGMMIASLRKEKGMTQLELAEQLAVTDKAVSKWERDLSCPDVGTLPKLAQILGVSVDELIEAKPEENETKKTAASLVPLILKAVALAMGVCVYVMKTFLPLNRLCTILEIAVGVAVYLEVALADHAIKKEDLRAFMKRK